MGNRECLSLPTESNKRNQQNYTENHFIVENYFKNLKSLITNEFESLKKSFLREVIIFKNELLQSIIVKAPEIDRYLENQILFLQRGLKEKNQVVN